MRSPRADAVLGTVAWATALGVMGVLALIVGDLLAHGAGRLDWAFLTTAPRNAGREGGIAPILVSTGLILAVTMAVALPLGLATAVLLSELTRRGGIFGRIVQRSLDVLAAVPSIVFGLFGNVFFCKTLGLGFSILSGGLTLACMVLPILIRTTEEGLRAVPGEMRNAASALAYSRSATLWHLLLPAATPALIVGLVLGLGRAIAETAALVYTSGYVDRMPESLLDSGRSLSIHIFDLSMNVAGGDATAYATSLTLILVLLTINALASLTARQALERRLSA